MSDTRDVEAVVLDVETTMKCPVGNNKASPFWPENRVVLWGMADALRSGNHVADHSCEWQGFDGLLIGHNIAFDLLYALKEGVFHKDQLGKLQIWDTQLAEYLLTGQTVRYPTLDFCAEKRGGTLKDDKVSTMFAAGMGADEVPRNMLADYLEGDLDNTRKVFLSQCEEAERKGMMPLLWSQMDARLATIEMIHNGLAIDRPFLTKRSDELRTEVSELEDKLRLQAYTLTGFFLDPTAPQQLAKVLFGGTVDVTVREEVGTYKNGKPKFKNKVVPTLVKNHYHFAANSEWIGKNGVPSTSDTVLEELNQRAPLSTGAKFINQVQSYRNKKKQLTTYFEGIDALIMPDGLLHHNLNHCVTATGRMSSSEPNLQNVTNGKEGDGGESIKKAFVSRWGDDGVIVEADFNQLEMVMLAVASCDSQLMADIIGGVDMHTALFKSMYGVPPTKAERKAFKPAAFALVYGAGATGIAGQTGMTKADAKKFIATFYGRYPEVKIWHEEMIALVESSRTSTGLKDKETGLPVGQSTYVCPMSGRNYVFREYPLPPEIAQWKGKTVGFSPTEIKNYPVQGGATGDIVPLVLGRLFRVLRNDPALRNKCLLINTVHDSIMFDCHKSVLDKAVVLIKQVMESAPQFVKEQWGFDFPLKLKVGVSTGPSWLDQTEISQDYFDVRAAA